jgi:hypothetical protein
MSDDRAVVDRIERYWRETGVPRATVGEMRSELEQHLALASQDGRGLTEVIGGDPAGFAESWPLPIESASMAPPRGPKSKAVRQR